MRRAAFTLILAALGLLLLYAWKVTEAKTSDEDEIKALERRYAKAFEAKDVDAVMANYIPGDELFVFDVIPPREYVGFAAYKRDWEGFLGMFPGAVKFEISDLKITTNGSNIAYSHSIQRVTGTMKDGKPLDLTVRVTDNYRKVNGKWLIAVEHVSVPVDIITGQVDLQSKP